MKRHELGIAKHRSKEAVFPLIHQGDKQSAFPYARILNTTQSPGS